MRCKGRLVRETPSGTHVDRVTLLPNGSRTGRRTIPGALILVVSDLYQRPRRREAAN